MDVEAAHIIATAINGLSATIAFWALMFLIFKNMGGK